MLTFNVLDWKQAQDKFGSKNQNCQLKQDQCPD